MNRMRLLAQSFCLILVTSLLISCAVSSVSVAPTAAPAATPEPPTPAPTPTESQVPRLTSQVPRISPEELKERLDNGEAILVVDARSTGDFEMRHIAGAISVPAYEVESRLDELPHDQEIVFYWTWPSESISAGAALKLYEHGYTRVSALLGGMRKWEEAGFPMEE